MVRCILLVFVTSIALTSCISMRREPATISRDEAMTVLERAHAHAQARNVDALCEVGGNEGMCRTDFDQAGGPEAVPAKLPHIVDSYILLDAGDWSGGRVLKLEGTDGRGQPFQSEFLVYDDTNRIVALTPVYWLNRNVALPGQDGSTTTDP